MRDEPSPQRRYCAVLTNGDGSNASADEFKYLEPAIAEKPDTHVKCPKR